MRRGSALAGVALLASACAPTTNAVQPQAAAPRPTHTPAGVDPVMGRTAAHLQGQFGPADLDVREGTARKLQFAGPACVLDAYLYPRAGGGDPVVTHIDARLPDGRDVDRASCIAALQAQRR